MTVARRTPRRGFTLFEIVTVMAALGAAMGLLTVVLWGSLRLEKASAADLQGLSLRQALAEQFRADVGQATEAPAAWNGHAAGPDRLILFLGPSRRVVYHWQTDRLTRTEFQGEKARQRELRTGGPFTVEFSKADAAGKLLTLRLSLRQRHGGVTSLLEITAALGGDLR